MARTGNETGSLATGVGTSDSLHHLAPVVGSLNSDGWETARTIVATPENDY
jgi:hypothetical protein